MRMTVKPVGDTSVTNGKTYEEREIFLLVAFGRYCVTVTTGVVSNGWVKTTVYRVERAGMVMVPAMFFGSKTFP